MTITLGDFEIANGDDRTAQVLGEEGMELTQETQTASPTRAAWKVSVWPRATRSLQRAYKVTFPPCDSLEDAVLQSAMIPVQCPAGGVLVEYHAGNRITYADAWIKGIHSDRIGVTNVFSFELECVNPTAQSLVADEDGDVITDETGAELDT